MALDATFRPFVVVGFFVIILIALPFRIKSQSTGEKLDRTQEGIGMMIGLRLAGLALWGGAIAFMISPASMAWSAMPLPAWTRWTGVAMSAATIPLLVWTLRSLGPNLTDTVVTRQAHTLTTSGPYALVRHPFYGCMAMFTISTGLMASNWFVLLAGVAVFSLLAIRSRIEEEKLLERFGEPYRDYRSRTGRFLPRVS